MLTAEEIIELITAFQAAEGEGVKSCELVLALVRWSPAPFSRHTFNPGHITCTGLVLAGDRGDDILLVHHRRLDRWLLPGGHCEAEDRSLAAVAEREVLEETGVRIARGVAPVLAGVDVHPIPSNGKEPLHLHHDLMFAFRAESVEVECSEESRAVAWCSRNEHDRYDLPAPIRRAWERAVRLRRD